MGVFKGKTATEAFLSSRKHKRHRSSKATQNQHIFSPMEKSTPRCSKTKDVLRTSKMSPIKRCTPPPKRIKRKMVSTLRKTPAKSPFKSPLSKRICSIIKKSITPQKSKRSLTNMMSESEILALGESEAIRLCEKTTIIETIISLTKHHSARVRQRALKEMCPCRVKEDLSDFWERVVEMVNDEAPNVRYQVLHTLCDGSPTHLEDKVADALDIFNYDTDPKIRRQAHKVLTGYRRTGKWNVM